MKPSLCLSLQQLSNHCLDISLHRQSTLFQNSKSVHSILYSPYKQYHSTFSSNSRSSTSNTHIYNNSHPSSNNATNKTICSKNLCHFNLTVSQPFTKFQNLNVTNKRNYSVSAPKTNSADNISVLDRFIYVKTLYSLYDDVHHGIILDTAYGDSRPDSDFEPSVPVVLALHDTPGSHQDVVPMLSLFAKLGCRTVCPTFPGHGETQGIMRNFDDIFSQSTVERAAFVQDFLNVLGIQRVDMVIGVGASCFTAMSLCARHTEVFKSMALISPWPFTQPRFQMDSKLLKYVHELWELVYLRPVARLLLPAFKIGNAPTTEEKMAACYLVQNTDFGEAEGFALTTSMQDVPRLVAYGGKDELVTEEMYADLLYKLGIDSKQVVSDHKMGLSKDMTNQPRALRFPDAGYDILTTHRSALCANILQFLQRFHPSIKI